MNTEDMREMTLQELQEEYVKLRKEQFNLRFQRASDQLAQTHLIKEARRNLARVNTIIREKRDG
ncbi:MAG: 50S ribosomal protein L29 [Gammaproteobacteria bacterium]|nr:50S ribosomal protein L29 [Gammaproteobacteria bacterium]MYC25477.1 50S ribosomal protein L29 [Gammaproteobacteria bacterium]